MEAGTNLKIYRISEHLLAVYQGNAPIGTIEIDSNPFHDQNAYLRFHLTIPEPRQAQSFFAQIQTVLQKPLQVIVSSQDLDLIDFLKAGGFTCRRKCLEMEVFPSDWTPPKNPNPFVTARRGTGEYEAQARNLYAYYAAVHEPVSPLTADFPAFLEKLPDTVWHQGSHYAFVEDNEIAYIGTSDIQSLRPFAQAVAAGLFAEYGSICLECDDCDPAAMVLRSLFSVKTEASYDTYLRPL